MKGGSGPGAWRQSRAESVPRDPGLGLGMLKQFLQVWRKRAASGALSQVLAAVAKTWFPPRPCLISRRVRQGSRAGGHGDQDGRRGYRVCRIRGRAMDGLVRYWRRRSRDCGHRRPSSIGAWNQRSSRPSLSGLPFHSSASAGGSFISLMTGQSFASSAFNCR